ncbi:MAG: SulP family inorganic anion transporter [Pirellulales bacterium]
MSTVTASAEKPQNGIAGFKHLRQDIVSGIVVSLVSLPLSSGIAIASGVPPVYGLISAIIAGLIFPFIGGAYQTIAGPAAGLAPALFMIMGWMGGVGDSSKVGEGYHFLLCVVFMVGVIQIVLAILKLARFAGIIPVSVVEGMLASIGLMIIVKQVSLLLGYLAPTSGEVPHPHEFIDFILAVPHYVEHMRVNVFAVGAATLVMLFVLDAMSKRFNFLKIIPPQLLAVIFGLILGRIINIGALEKTLISLPGNPFEHGVSFPNFAELMTRSDLWQAAIVAVIMLTMIDGVESLATAMAIDRIDPFKRKSEPNRVLLAMGISNIASSLVGGLTIIPGGVKSKANIASGGRTLWANFTNAICLIIYMLVARDVINMIPLSILAAVLIFTGWKMCRRW